MSNTARVLAILQIIIGLFLLGISIADVAVYFVQFLANNISGIALGMWVSKNIALAAYLKIIFSFLNAWQMFYL